MSNNRSLGDAQNYHNHKSSAGACGNNSNCTGPKFAFGIIAGVLAGIIISSISYMVAAKIIESNNVENVNDNETVSIDSKDTETKEKYIFFADLGVKFRKPSINVTYSYDSYSTDGGKIKFWGTPEGTQATSASGYEDATINTEGIVTITARDRKKYEDCIKTESYDDDGNFTCTIDGRTHVFGYNYTAGEKVFETDKYVFLREHAQALWSSDESEITAEVTVSNALDEMIYKGMSKI